MPSFLNLMFKKIPRKWSEFGKALVESALIQLNVPLLGLITILDEDNNDIFDKNMSLKVRI